jgi:hypothetical protein
MHGMKKTVRLLSSQDQEAACIRVADRFIDLFADRAGKGDLDQLHKDVVQAEEDVAWAEMRLGSEPKDFLWNNHQVKTTRGRLVMAKTRLRRVTKQREPHAYLLVAANQWLDNSAL